MRLGRIIGKVWATKKDASLSGVALFVLQPLDYEQMPQGQPIIAVDAIGAGEGETVFWVGGGDATLAFDGKITASDASIVGIVDSVNAISTDKPVVS